MVDELSSQPQGNGRGTMPKQMKVTEEVYMQLTDLGKKNETYSQIIQRLINEHYELERLRQKPPEA